MGDFLNILQFQRMLLCVKLIIFYFHESVIITKMHGNLIKSTWFGICVLINEKTLFEQLK